MTLIDHLFVLLFAVVFPITGFISFRRLQRRVAAGETVNRGRLYLNTSASQWLLFVLAVVVWWFAARPWADLGLSFSGDRNFLIGVVLTVIGIAFLVFQILQVRKSDDEELRRLRASFADLLLMMPRNGNELARFYGLSLTAGIVEELLWRGFLFWYLGHFMPLWAAAIVSSLGFGIAHAYQGWRQVPAIVLVGAVFSGLYLLTGSLWLSIVMHIAVDVLQGRMVYEVLHRCDFDDVGNGSTVAAPG